MAKKKTKIKEQKPSWVVRFLSKIKTYLFTGILVTAPVGMTFYIAFKLIVYIDKWSNAIVPEKFRFSQYLKFDVPGLGVAVIVTALVLIGMFTTGYVGRFFVRLGEKILSKMPFISSVYNLLKQVFETFFSGKKQSFNQVVLLEYPRKGIWVLGFVSAKTGGEIGKKIDGKVLNVFVPTTPNPTSGFLIFVPESEVIKLKMSVEDGLKLVISCGIVTPTDIKEKMQIKK
ncbi:MAG: DUF502 domain-containing protein [Alphaproteobacteria bacterium]|nr:DUF502 domain-containing protein [Alphaproteobacteria bacterium]